MPLIDTINPITINNKPTPISPRQIAPINSDKIATIVVGSKRSPVWIDKILLNGLVNQLFFVNTGAIIFLFS